jgi:hypothetical protein
MRPTGLRALPVEFTADVDTSQKSRKATIELPSQSESAVDTRSGRNTAKGQEKSRSVIDTLGPLIDKADTFSWEQYVRIERIAHRS